MARELAVAGTVAVIVTDLVAVTTTKLSLAMHVVTLLNKCLMDVFDVKSHRGMMRVS